MHLSLTLQINNNMRFRYLDFGNVIMEVKEKEKKNNIEVKYNAENELMNGKYEWEERWKKEYTICTIRFA